MAINRVSFSWTMSQPSQAIWSLAMKGWSHRHGAVSIGQALDLLLVRGASDSGLLIRSCPAADPYGEKLEGYSRLLDSLPDHGLRLQLPDALRHRRPSGRKSIQTTKAPTETCGQTIDSYELPLIPICLEHLLGCPASHLDREVAAAIPRVDLAHACEPQPADGSFDFWNGP